MVSDQEKREVQCLSKIYPEIASYLAEIEDELADAVLENGVTPPQGLKAKILDNLPERDDEEEEVRETPVISLVEKRSEEKIEEPVKRKFPYGIAASFAVIIALGTGYLSTRSQVGTLTEELIQTQTRESFVTQQNEALEATNAQLAAEFNMVSNPNTLKIELGAVNEELAQAVQGAPVIVFWNPESQEVMLNDLALPEAPEGSQYQLWTLEGGQPINRGMLSLGGEAGLQKMISANAADAFAITLEPKGGSESPTLEQLMVLGKVES